MSLQSSSSSARRALGLAGFIALSLVAASASASDDAVVQKTVRYADLNLDKSADASRLYERLGNAAEAVCSHHEGRDLLTRKMRRACESEALSNAVLELDNPAVTALHTADARVRVAQQRTNTQPKS